MIDGHRRLSESRHCTPCASLSLTAVRIEDKGRFFSSTKVGARPERPLSPVLAVMRLLATIFGAWSRPSNLIAAVTFYPVE